MDHSSILWLASGIFIAAILYSSVGHGGGSGYLAVMALFDLAPDVMKPTALALNILVALIATLRFCRAGCFSGSLFWPLILTSLPAAFIGGTLALPPGLYRPIVGLVLVVAALRLLPLFPVTPTHPETPSAKHSVPSALGWGAGMGLLSGLTGVGGGIFLSPLLLFMGWTDTRQTAGVVAAFVCLNSVAGLAGHITRIQTLPSALLIWAIAAGLGGLIGSDLGSRRFSETMLRRVLAGVLVIAGGKLLFS